VRIASSSAAYCAAAPLSLNSKTIILSSIPKLDG